jgi:hypothetical protein
MKPKQTAVIFAGALLSVSNALAATVTFQERVNDLPIITTNLSLSGPLEATSESATVNGVLSSANALNPITPGSFIAGLSDGNSNLLSDYVLLTAGQIQPTGLQGTDFIQNVTVQFFSNDILVSDLLASFPPQSVTFGGSVPEDGTVQNISTLLNSSLYFGSLSVYIQSAQSDALETPLPAAFTLFATGLGALGLLGWRRKRKGAATAAA